LSADDLPGNFSNQPHTRAQGRMGEDAAVRWLVAHGYQILDRNVTNHCGEIDVVAREGGTLCFLEIKARASNRFGPAIAAVDFRKQRRISRAAALYIAVKGLHRETCRFDVLGLDRETSGGWRYTLVRDAFPYAR
jgi:putative endonuclease